MIELRDYLIANKVTQRRIVAETHDISNRLLPHRDCFADIKQYAEGFLQRGQEPRLLGLAGLRGVGKTTLMWQTARYIFEKITEEIYFINVDDLNRLGYTLFEAFGVLEKEVLLMSLYELDKPIVFLIDEVHEAEGWDKDLKILYERCKQAFIMCTGSSALLLHKSPDLATRWSLMRVYPLSFTEYIHAKFWQMEIHVHSELSNEVGQKLRQALLYAEDIDALHREIGHHAVNIRNFFTTIQEMLPAVSVDDLIYEYMSFHNIVRFLPIQNKALINDRIIDLFERILLKDIPLYTPLDSNDKDLLFRLLLRLALSDEISYEKLAASIGCKLPKIEQCIEMLHQAEILNVLSPYGGVKKKTTALKKTFFMSPSLRRALFQRIYGEKSEGSLLAKLYEDTIAMYLKRMLPEAGLLSFGMKDGAVSPDFVVETGDVPVIIEVGTQKLTVRQTEKYGGKKRYGVIISASQIDYHIRDNTLIMPLSWFLLL